jgi:serine/threonine protein kinase
MSVSLPATGPGVRADHGLAEVVEQLTARLKAGEAVDLDACLAAHPEHAAELRRLFPALELLADVSRSPSPALSRPAPAGPAAGEILGQLGDFRLLREVGRGGMGVVYEAVQLSLNRRVALKVLPFAGALDARQLQRFKNEAQAAAHLQHQHIVPVYYVGCERGVHFYAMQFIDGRTLAQLIQERRRPTGADTAGKRAGQAAADPEQTTAYQEDAWPAADGAPATVADQRAQAETPPAGARPWCARQDRHVFRAVARLGAQAAEALEHAHQLGVVHRDIKPGNLLLDARGELWVTDFGLAQVQGDPKLTLTGDLVGTLRYMSPEQALAKRVPIDHRTDVYSLGVTLYELLTLEPAFAGTDRQELLRQIAFQEPRPPRRLNPALPAELETVVLKAMAKEPAERYATAQELADDLEHFLKDEPIRARRPSAWQRLRRWGRRHRPVVAAGAAMLVTLLVTAVVALAAGIVAVNREQGRTQAALKLEAERRRQARAALDAMTSPLVEDWLTRQKAQTLTQQQKQFLREALVAYEEFARDTAEDETSRAGVAAAYLRVGRIRWKLGQFAGAEAAYRRSLQLYARLAAVFPTVPEYRWHQARSHNDLGYLLADTGRPKEAEAAYRDALARQKQLAADFPAVPEYRRHLAGSHLNLGVLLMRTGRPRAAEAAYRDALAIEKQLAADFPAVPEYRLDLAVSRADLGNLLADTGPPKEAEAAYRDALARQKQLAADFPAVPEYRQGLAATLNNLGMLLIRTGRPKEAEAAYRDGLAIEKHLAADFPTVPEYRRDLARTHHNMGTLQMRTGRPEEAEAAYRDALAIEKHLAADFPTVPQYRRDLATSRLNLGSLLADTGRPKEAEGAYRDGLAIEKQLAADFPTVPEYREQLANIHNHLGILLKDTGRPRDAEAAYRDALAIRKQLAADFPTVPEHRRDLATSHNNLGNLLAGTGRLKQAEAAYRDALARQKQLAADFPAVPEYREELANIHNRLGILLRHTGRPGDAEAAYRGALVIQKRLAAEFPTVPDYQNDLAGTLVNLGNLFCARGEYAAARSAHEEAFPHHQAALQSNPRNPTYRLFFRNNRWGLTEALVALSEHRAAAVAATQLLEAAVAPASDACNAACYLAYCASLAEKDKRLSDVQRKELTRSYADKAMAALRQAVRNGFNDVARMQKAAGLDALRGRPDFKQLLGELAAKAKAAGK